MSNLQRQILVENVIIIEKTLHGLKTSCQSLHSHVAKSFRTFGFTQIQFDNDACDLIKR